MAEIIPAYGHMEQIRTMFRNYITWIGVPQNYRELEAELAALPGPYVHPEGRFYLLREGDEILGCGAIRPLRNIPGTDGERRCELKRMLVRPEGRGRGLGQALVQQLIDDARSMGYSEIVMDAAAFMQPVLDAYHRLGFREIPPYYDNPPKGLRFLGLRLDS
jgi:ribosomal protein S18 acetylase RimI-like enzyme